MHERKNYCSFSLHLACFMLNIIGPCPAKVRNEQRWRLCYRITLKFSGPFIFAIFVDTTGSAKIIQRKFPARAHTRLTGRPSPALSYIVTRQSCYVQSMNGVLKSMY